MPNPESSTTCLSLLPIDVNATGDISAFVTCICDVAADQIETVLRKVSPRVLILTSNQTQLLSGVASDRLPSHILVVETSDTTTDPMFAARSDVSVIHCEQLTGNWPFVLAEVERVLRPISKPLPPSPKLETVLVGSGIVNLVTALELVQAGHNVSILDRMPNPLKCDVFEPFETGATFGGMDARVFSLNESRHHLYRGESSNVSSHQPFRKRVSNAGWLSRDYDELNTDEQAWIARLQELPAWLSGAYNNDIISYNRESAYIWDALFTQYPELLRGTNHNPTLLRVYQTEASFVTAQQLERYLGSCHEVLPNDILAQQQPCFIQAISEGAIAGALRVEGFSLNIKSFSRNFIRFLSRKGVRFHWKSAVDAICRDDDGRVSGIRVGAETIRATNIVICPGVYAALSCNTIEALSDIASMVGMWITLPNEDSPLTAPLKIRRRGFAAQEAAEGANIIPGRDKNSRPVIYCSSGHGFVGASPQGVTSCDLQELLTCIKETSCDLFRDKYLEAERRGMLDVEPEYCIRPWTSSGLGVFDRLETVDGGQLILTGGHNTGGFAQAPSVAVAVRKALEGETPQMAQVYHPERAHAFQ